MKKKIFFQTNIFYQLFICLPIFILFLVSVSAMIGWVYRIIDKGFGENAKDIIITVVYLLGFLIAMPYLLLVGVINSESENIHLDSQKVYMNGGRFKPKGARVQFYTEVKYKDIRELDITWANKNSKGTCFKDIRVAISNFVISPFLTIIDDKGKKKNFYVQFMAKKTLEKLINEIKWRMKEVGNMTEVQDTAELMEKRKKFIPKRRSSKYNK